MENIKLAIVIAVHNRKQVTLQCLVQLAKQTERNFSTILVDDGSTDGTSAAVSQFYPSVKIIPGTGDWWWTRSVNEGIRYALQQDASHVLLLNDDTYFTTDYVERVKTEINLHPASIIGSLNLTSEKPYRVYFSGAKSLNRILFRYTRYHKTFSLYRPEEPVTRRPSVYLPARGAIIPTTVFRAIGLLDDQRFPQYASDVEFTLTAHEKGFDIYVCSGLKIFTPVDSTGSGDIYKKESFFKFVSSFRNKHAKRHLSTNLQLIRNHVPVYLAPLSFVVYIGSILAKYFIHKIKSQ